MLAIEVTFLTGRYVATAYNTRLEAEWPPHPARLFSALVATHFSGESPAPQEKAALEWLEAQGAPAIRASEASTRDGINVFVPVNDVAMTDVDAEAQDLDEARIALGEARELGAARATQKAETRVKSAERRLAAAIARSVGVGARRIDARAGRRVLPEGRPRQPRTFPSVTPADPNVTYVWLAAQPTPTHRDALDGLLQRLVRLGHSSSVVAARILDKDVTPVWRPSKAGETILRTVNVGQFDALERAYHQHRETEPRVMPARFERYTRRTPDDEMNTHESVFSDEWLVLKRVGGPSLPVVACAGIARTLRKALMSHATNIPEMLSGHASQGVMSERDHLAIVPLPFVGHHHASGAILGAALVLPRNCTPGERRAVYGAVAAWERAVRQEDEDTPRLPLTLGVAGVLELERVQWGAVQASLRPGTWCLTATTWSSVTPIALDKNPGELRSRDRTKLAQAIEQASETIRRACERVGLPRPSIVEILPAAPWAGAAKAKSYPSFPGLPGRTQRVLTHARIAFSLPVRGPVLIGAGRYHGLGLFRPELSNG